jgi:NADPH-dependent 2,4-dienoyl-CoA reductase/sulfur reductase-like enzyme
VTVIDDNPTFGGQIWRAEKQKLSARAKELVDALDKNGVEMIASCTCVASLPDKRILALSKGKMFPIAYDKVILATGARERFIPFPGWTLPGVYGAGGLQALVKGGFDVSGKRIAVAGTGPLLLAVGAYLKKKGGNVLFIAEQAPLRRLVPLGLASLRVPGKFSEAMKLRKEVRGIPYRTSSIVASADGEGSLETVTVRRKKKSFRVECDLLAAGYHLVPNTEVAEMFGCAVVEGFVLVDELQRTTIEDVFCAGEPTKIGGLDLALVEGRMAGLAAAGIQEEAAAHTTQRSRLERFAAAMNSAFRLETVDLRGIASDDTIVCRCEDVCYGKVKTFDNFTDAKLQTRLGMGFCQGRVCGAACEALFGWESSTLRPPIVPIRVGELANLNTEKT